MYEVFAPVWYPLPLASSINTVTMTTFHTYVHEDMSYTVCLETVKLIHIYQIQIQIQTSLFGYVNTCNHIKLSQFHRKQPNFLPSSEKIGSINAHVTILYFFSVLKTAINHYRVSKNQELMVVRKFLTINVI